MLQLGLSTCPLPPLGDGQEPNGILFVTSGRERPVLKTSVTKNYFVKVAKPRSPRYSSPMYTKIYTLKVKKTIAGWVGWKQKISGKNYQFQITMCN